MTWVLFLEIMRWYGVIGVGFMLLFAILVVIGIIIE